MNAEGKVLRCTRLHWRNYDLKKELSAWYGVPIDINNDVNLALIAEQRFGKGQNCGNLVYLHLGEGIGCGILCNGQLVAGHSFMAGEIGRTVLRQSTEDASVSLEEAIGLSCFGSMDAFLCAVSGYTRGRERDVETIQRFIRVLTSAIVFTVGLLNPHRLILGGVMSEAMPDILEDIREAVTARTSTPVDIQLASLGGAGLVNREGKILSSSRRPVVRDGLEKLVESLTEQARELLKDAAEQPCSMGVGIKGLVDDRHNCLVSSSILGGGQRKNLRELLEETIGLPCVIDNDVNRGSENTCGEVCNMLLSLPGEEGLFSLEAVASGQGLAEEAARLAPQFPGSVLVKSGKPVCAQDIFSAAREKDRLAERIIENAIYALTLSTVNMEAVTGAGLYIFGGGVVSDPLIFDRLRDGVPEFCRRYGLRLSMDLRISSLGAADAGLLGAARLAFTR